MENLTPGSIIVLVIGGILAVAGFVNTVGSAIEKLVKAAKAAKAPNEEQNERITELEKWRIDVDRRLIKGDEHFSSLDEGNRVTQLALLALLDHSLDGNNITQMQHAKEELQNYLINRQ